MKYILAVVLGLAASAFAAPSVQDRNAIYARQANVVGPQQVPVAQPAMTDRFGNVIPFNTRGVYLDSKARGL